MAPVKDRPILFTGEMVRAILGGRKVQTRRVYKDPAGPSFPEFIGYTGEESDLDQWLTSWSYGGEDGDPVSIQDANERHGGGICPFGAVGDLLWVRETWWRDSRDIQGSGFESIIYDATPEWAKSKRQGVFRCSCPDDTLPTREECRNNIEHNRFWSKRPSIFMPHWASRLTLRITDIRIERVQGITGRACVAEGMELPRWKDDSYPGIDPGIEHDEMVLRHLFSNLWDSINGKRGHSWESNPWVWVLSFERVEKS